MVTSIASLPATADDGSDAWASRPELSFASQQGGLNAHRVQAIASAEMAQERACGVMNHDAIVHQAGKSNRCARIVVRHQRIA